LTEVLVFANVYVIEDTVLIVIPKSKRK
jgi:hypothetical protein